MVLITKVGFLSTIQEVLANIGKIIKTCVDFILFLPKYFIRFRELFLTFTSPFRELFLIALTMTFIALFGKLISFIMKIITGGIAQ